MCPFLYNDDCIRLSGERHASKSILSPPAPLEGHGGFDSVNKYV